jgi:uncharacterized membrane protein YkvA (DUF1232 family)
VTDKILILFSAMRDKRTPWYAKAMLGLMLAYIVSPVDLIPDFIPVIGLLDEVVLVPIAFTVIFKLIPDSVRQDGLLYKIDEVDKNRLIISGIFMVITIWLVFLLLLLLYSSLYS